MKKDKLQRKLETYAEAGFIMEEIGKTISSATLKQIIASIKAMQTAMEVLGPLAADNADEEVAENELVQIEQPLEETKSSKWELVSVTEAAKILAQNDSYDSIRSLVSSALRKRVISDSLKQKVANTDSIGYDDYYDYHVSAYIRDMYDDTVVYSLGGQLYQCDYSVASGVVTLGDATAVQVSYVPIPNTSSRSNTEAQEIEIHGDLIQLQEKAVRDDGIARIKLISPGWGSSGYYSEKVLKRDGPKAFKAGTHMYMNHPTEEEDRNRPERDVKDLAGILVTNPTWENQTATNTGPGLYADAKVVGPYKDFIDEVAPYIGVSIRASGKASEGEAENRHGMIIDGLTEGFSVDYVTMAGRGGEILPLYESARSRIGNVQIDETDKTNTRITITETTNGGISNVEETKVEVFTVEITAEELAALKEAAANGNRLSEQIASLIETNKTQATEIARLQEARIISEANAVVARTLNNIAMPNIVRERLAVQCAANPPVTENRTLDVDKLTEATKEAALAELKYLENVTGSVTGGRVQGMTAPATTELNEADINTELESLFRGFGLNESASKVASKGRNE